MNEIAQDSRDSALMPHETEQTEIRVLIVEDHPIYIDGLRTVLEAAGGFVVAGEARSPAQATALSRVAHANIVLLDIGLAGSDGLDVVNQIRRINPDVQIVVLTGNASDDNEHLLRALRLGVRGFLYKEMPSQELVAALRAVHEGQRVIGKPQALTTVLDEFGHLMQERERERHGLTAQEIDILRLAASGLNNRSIGECRYWSEITVKRKMREIYHKLNVSGRAQAVAEAIRLGFI